MEGGNPMSGVVTALTTGITPTSLFGEVTAIIPFVATMVVFAFGFHLVRRAIRKAQLGKAGA